MADQVSETELLSAMRTLDMAVLMGGPLFRPQLDTTIHNLTLLLRETQAKEGRGTETQSSHPAPSHNKDQKEEDGEASGNKKRLKYDDDDDPNQCRWGGWGKKEGVGESVVFPPGAFASMNIERILLPSLEDFLCSVLSPAVPTILVGAMEQWAARDRWRDVTYLKKVGGARTVPVEVRKERWREEEF